MKKSIVAGLTILTLAYSGVIASDVMAAEADGRQGRMSSIVQAITERFGLNQDEVQAVFDEAREEKQAEKGAEMLSQLDQFVEDGSITEEQKQLIIAKQEELQADRETQKESMQDLTEEERQTARESEREAIESWADENGIDMQYLMPGRGQGGHGGPGGPGPRGGQPPAKPTAE